MFTAPTAVRQRRKINKLPSMREEQNKLRHDVNDLAEENRQLHALSDKVEQQASRLSEAEVKLNRIAEVQGASVAELQRMVMENGVLTREMRALQECQVMGQMMKAIMESDRTRDFRIDDKEMHVLLMRLRAIKGLQHVNESDLRTALASSKTGSIKGIVDLTKELMHKDQLQIVRKAEQDAAAASPPTVI